MKLSRTKRVKDVLRSGRNFCHELQDRLKASEPSGATTNDLQAEFPKHVLLASSGIDTNLEIHSKYPASFLMKKQELFLLFSHEK